MHTSAQCPILSASAVSLVVELIARMPYRWPTPLRVFVSDVNTQKLLSSKPPDRAHVSY